MVMTYESFVAHLKSLRAYNESTKKLKIDVYVLEYDLEGVKAIRYDKIPGSYNPSYNNEKQLEKIDEYNEVLQKLNKEEKIMLETLELVKKPLETMPKYLKNMVIEKYIDGVSFDDLGRKYGYSERGMSKMLKREVEKYL